MPKRETKTALSAVPSLLALCACSQAKIAWQILRPSSAILWQKAFADGLVRQADCWAEKFSF